MNKIRDLTGQKFGLLSVLYRAENTPEGRVKWLCQCHAQDVDHVLIGFVIGFWVTFATCNGSNVVSHNVISSAGTVVSGLHPIQSSHGNGPDRTGDQ